MKQTQEIETKIDDLIHEYRSWVKHSNVPIYLEENVIKAMQKLAEFLQAQQGESEAGLSEYEIKELKVIRNYFGVHDKSPTEHAAYSILDRIIKKFDTPAPVIESPQRDAYERPPLVMDEKAKSLLEYYSSECSHEKSEYCQSLLDVCLLPIGTCKQCEMQHGNNLQIDTKVAEIVNSFYNDIEKAKKKMHLSIKEEDDYILFPYEGICGKCGNRSLKLNKDFLCEHCISMGVCIYSFADKDALESIKKFVTLRVRPTPASVEEKGEGERMPFQYLSDFVKAEQKAQPKPSVKEEDAEGVKPSTFLKQYPALRAMLDREGYVLKEMMWRAMQEYAARDYKSAKGIELPSEEIRLKKIRELAFGIEGHKQHHTESLVEFDRWLISEIRRLNDPQGE